MKLLLDEQIPRKLSKLFPDAWEVKTVQEMGWAGTLNGALLSIAADTGFQAMLTADKNLQYQQNPQTLPFPIIVLAAPSTRIDDLSPLIPIAVELLESQPTHEVHRVESPQQ